MRAGEKIVEDAKDTTRTLMQESKMTVKGTVKEGKRTVRDGRRTVRKATR